MHFETFKSLLTEVIVVEPFSLLGENRLLIALIYNPSGVPSNSQIFILYVFLRSLSKGEFVFPSDETGVATATLCVDRSSRTLKGSGLCSVDVENRLANLELLLANLSLGTCFENYISNITNTKTHLQITIPFLK